MIMSLGRETCTLLRGKLGYSKIDCQHLYFVNFAISTVFTSVIPFYPIIALQKGIDFVVTRVMMATTPILSFITSLVLGDWL
jgi:hypothetical protein